MSFERYLAGDRVYRHGSHAPTMGTVDPAGYVQRELRKRMLGQDGVSDTRSGLAAAALRRIGGGGVTPMPTRQFNPGGGTGVTPMPQRIPSPTGTFSPGGNGNVPGAAGVNNPVLQAKIAAVKAEHLAEQHAQQAALKAKMAMRPSVSPVGKVSSTKKKPANPTALPWDMNAMTQKINAGNEFGQLRNALLAARQNAQSEYSQGMFDVNKEQPGAERGLLNNFAGRGLAFGSGYGMGVGELQDKFANMRAAIQNRLNNNLTDYQNQETQGSATYNQKLSAIQQALAQRLAGQAGSLGFGPKTLAKPKPKVKKGKK